MSSAGAVAGALHDLTAKALDLVGRHLAEVVVERLAGFQLLAVDQQRAWARQRFAVLVEVAEQLQPPVLQAWSCRLRSARWKPEM